jgi:hypothetical protein
MDWYYAVNDQRMGPVSEAEFLRLIASGEVRPETLVWREGMTAWQPCREVQPAALGPVGVCSDCGAILPEDELVTIDERRVCAACKPAFLQRMREGVETAAPADRVLDSKRLTLSELLALSWSVWLKNFGVIVLLTLLTSIPTNLILQAVTLGAEATPRELGRFIRVVMLLQLLLGSLSTMGIAYSVAESISGREVRFGAALRHAFSRWLAAVGTGFLENIILVFLFLLLIVPGIIWLGYYTFSIYVVALRDLAGKRALDYSKDLVRGRWWRVVGFVFAVLAMTVFPLILVQLIVPSDDTIIAFVTSTLGDVLTSFLIVAIGVLFLNLDSLKQAGRLD